MDEHGQARSLADAYRKLTKAATRVRTAARKLELAKNEQHAAGEELNSALAVVQELVRNSIEPEYEPTADACRETFPIEDVTYVCMRPRGHDGDHKGTAKILVPIGGKLHPKSVGVLREFGKKIEGKTKPIPITDLDDAADARYSEAKGAEAERDHILTFLDEQVARLDPGTMSYAALSDLRKRITRESK